MNRRSAAPAGGAAGDDAKPVGPAVVKRTHFVLSRILADAVRDNLIAKNPRVDVKLPRTTRKRPVYLTHGQVGALAAAAGEWDGLVLLLAYCGLRWGEAIGLRVHDLDMLRKRASVTENASSRATKYTLARPRLTSSARCRCQNFCCRIWPVNAKARHATGCSGPAMTAGT